MRDFEVSPGNHTRMVQSEPPEISAPDGNERSDRKHSLSTIGSSLSSFISSSSLSSSTFSSSSAEIFSFSSLPLLVVVAIMSVSFDFERKNGSLKRQSESSFRKLVPDAKTFGRALLAASNSTPLKPESKVRKTSLHSPVDTSHKAISFLLCEHHTRGFIIFMASEDGGKNARTLMHEIESENVRNLRCCCVDADDEFLAFVGVGAFHRVTDVINLESMSSTSPVEVDKTNHGEVEKPSSLTFTLFTNGTELKSDVKTSPFAFAREVITPLLGCQGKETIALLPTDQNDCHSNKNPTDVRKNPDEVEYPSQTFRFFENCFKFF